MAGEMDLGLDQGWVKGQVQCGARMPLGLSLAMALRLEGTGEEGSTVRSVHADVCAGCPEPRNSWRREEGEQGGPGVEGELQPWEGEAADSLLHLDASPPRALPAQTSQVARPAVGPLPPVFLWTL